jgi:hypothetical protein
MRRLALAAGAIVSFNAFAAASVIVFSNTNPVFDWHPFIYNQGPGTYLDITQPSSQSGGSSPISIDWFRGEAISSDVGATHDMDCGTSIRVVRSTVPVQVPLDNSGLTNVYPPRAFVNGDVVGPGANWLNTATLGWYRLGTSDHWIVGTSFTMGLQVTLADGIHYGFADMVLTSTQYQPVDWGYESNPGVALTVPAPAGGVVLFAAGLLGARRRRA